jgi:hypothetical protein
MTHIDPARIEAAKAASLILGDVTPGEITELADWLLEDYYPEAEGPLLGDLQMHFSATPDTGDAEELNAMAPYAGMDNEELRKHLRALGL